MQRVDIDPAFPRLCQEIWCDPSLTVSPHPTPEMMPQSWDVASAPSALDPGSAEV